MEVIDGAEEGMGVAGNNVFVGMIFVLTATGVSVTPVAAQDTRNIDRRRLSICFIAPISRYRLMETSLSGN